jgi:glycosyltransferase involved in cell wall biosynthesis
MRAPKSVRKGLPRILTNVRLYTVAGIAQYVSGLISYNETSKDFDLYGVDILRPDEPQEIFPQEKRLKHFHLLRSVVDYPPLGTVNQLSQGDLAIVHQSFRKIIDAYAKAIRRIQPDIILINGSYFLPWCLLQAAQEYGKATIFMHYHGILTKEVAHWPNAADRDLMLKMERSFDDEHITYIFPSHLSKRIVEREVFGHKISQSKVLANPVAPEFFVKPTQRKDTTSIGVVSRWSKIKNIDFVVSLAKRNARSKKPFTINIVSDLKSAKDMRPFSGLMRFNKPMANKRLARFYGRQGVIISPSIFETYGNVPQEAVASGTPALVNSKMGIAETFRKIGLSDWVIDFTSPAKTLKKARAVASAGVPQQAITALRDHYSSEKIFKQYTALLSRK